MQQPQDGKRKVNVFEYNNLASNNKKMRMINLNKPLQRTDIIQLENSLDFDKTGPTNTNKKKGKKSVMMNQNFLKSNNFQPSQLSKKISLKSLKASENDDRKTFISSNDRQFDSISNKSRRKSSKPTFKVKRIHKRIDSNSNLPIKVLNTPQKSTSKSTESNIIITKRNDNQKIVHKRKKIVFDQSTLNKYKEKNIRFDSHERKVSEAWGNRDANGLKMYRSKQLTSSISTPMIVTNGTNAMHRHYKSKDTFTGSEHKLQSQKSYKNIYSKPVNSNMRMNNQSDRKRKKGRGFPSQHQVQSKNTAILMEGTSVRNLYHSFSNQSRGRGSLALLNSASRD